MQGPLLSELEELVLLAAALCRQDAYGYVVKETLREQAGRMVSLATVHAALYRLEKKGYLRSHLGGATQARGGRRKRLFVITSAGLSALRNRQEVRVGMWNRVEQLHPVGDTA